MGRSLLPSLVVVVVLGRNALHGVDLEVDHTLQLGLLVLLIERDGTLLVDWTGTKMGGEMSIYI